MGWSQNSPDSKGIGGSKVGKDIEPNDKFKHRSKRTSILKQQW